MIVRDEKIIVEPLLVIEDLERRQARAVRDAILRLDLKRLKDIDDDIAWLRELMKKRNG